MKKIISENKILYIIFVCFIFGLMTICVNNVSYASTITREAEKTTLEKINDLLAKIDGLNEADYTEASWKALMDVRKNMGDMSQVPAEYQQTVLDKLQGLVDGLEESTLGKINALLAKIDGLNEADYTETSWKALMDVRKNMGDMSQLPAEHQQTVLDKLQGLVDGLEPVKPEQSTLDKLKALLAEIDALNESDYTAESWKELMDLRNEVDNPESLSETMQKVMLKNLQELRDALEKTEEKNPSGKIDLADGTYRVTLVNYDGLTGRLGTSVGREYGMAALIDAKDHHYKITLRLREMDQEYIFNILKPEYAEDTFWGQQVDSGYMQKMGTKCWGDYDTSRLDESIRKGISEENNKFWYDLASTYLSDGGGTLSFETDTLTDLRIYRIVPSYGNIRTKVEYLNLDFGNVVSTDDLNFAEMGTVSVEYFMEGDISSRSPEKYFQNNSVQWTTQGEQAIAKIPVNPEIIEEYPEAAFSDKAGNTLTIEGNYVLYPVELKAPDVYYAQYLKMSGVENRETEFYLLFSKETTQVVLEEDTTGTQIVTTDNVLSATTKLKANEIIDDPKDPFDPYSLIHNNLSDSAYEHMYAYYWTVEAENGEEDFTTSSKVKLRFKLWDDTNTDNVYILKVDSGGWEPGLKGKIETDENGSYCVYDTNELGYYAVYEMKDTTSTGEKLEDGTWSVPLTVYHLTDEGKTSMADRCLGKTGTIVVKDNGKYLYMDYTTVENLDMESYMTKMWLYDTDQVSNSGNPTGNLVPVIFDSYYKNEDGTYLTDAFNEGTLNYYPKTGYVKLISDNGRWPARFKVPIMDAIGGGNFEQSAWLTIDWANAEKVSDETPDAPIQTALGEALSIAETAVQEEYTPDSWKTLEDAYKKAEEASKSDNAETMNTAYAELHTAIDGLKKPDTFVLDEGVYLAEAALSDESDTVTDLRILGRRGEDESISAAIRLTLKNVTALTYYDVTQKKYIEAELVKDADDNVISAELIQSNPSSSVALKYTDKDGKEHSATLTISNLKKQAIDKTALNETIAKANEILKNAGQYEQDKIAELNTALSSALPVSKDEFAIQSEIDAQKDVLQKAIDAVTSGSNLETLKELIAKAKETDESKYTPESYQALTDAIAHAETVLGKEGVSNEEIEAELTALQAVLEKGLVLRADKTALTSLIQEAETIADEGQSGYADLQNVIQAAKETEADENASQTEVDAQVKALQAAIDNLDGGIDKSQLNSMISQAEQIELSGFDEDSVKQLQAVVASAKYVSGSSAATQTAVDKHIQLLDAAAKALFQKADANTVYDGTYTINGELRHASQNQPSMGNGAMVKPFRLIKDGDTYKLRIEMQPLSTKLGTTDFTGYLADLWYYEGYMDEEIPPSMAKSTESGGETARAAAQAATDAQTQAADAQSRAAQAAQNAAQLQATADELAAQFETASQNAAQLQNAALEAQANADNALAAAQEQQTEEAIQASNDAALAAEAAVNTANEAQAAADALQTQYQEAAAAAQEAAQNAAELQAVADNAAASAQTLQAEQVAQAASAQTSARNVLEDYPLIAAEVEESFDDVYDTYNDPENGTDERVKGKLYPKHLDIPVQLEQNVVWTRVYVPVMEAISKGSGEQDAKLLLDWSTQEQVSGTNTDRTELQAKTKEAEALQAELSKDSQGFDQAQLDMLAQVIATSKSVDVNRNVTQEIVDNQTAVIEKAMKIFTKEAVETDKTELEKAIQSADSYLNNTDVEYDPATLKILQAARERAQKILDDPEATQTQVNKSVEAINSAIAGLTVSGTDKNALKKALNTAEGYLKESGKYTGASIQALQSAYDKAKAVYEDEKATQAQIDSQTGVLTYLTENMKVVTETAVNKDGLHSMIVSAANLAGRENLYTADSISALKKAIKNAEKVYQDEKASQEEVDAQASALSMAMLDLTAKEPQNNGGNNNGNNNNGNNNNGGNNNNNNNNNNNGSLDINKLADGVYSLTGNMVKIDKVTASMSNDAINHTVKLTVKDGAYYITLDFKGLAISGQFGYLGTLKYFKTGYGLDKYGVPQGDLSSVTVEAYQKDSDGNTLKDNFGTNYPDLVTFPLIKEARADGYVPLQVFVPIMESISAGTGTQAVFLKLDWSALKKTTEDDPGFENENNNGSNNNGTDDNKNNGNGTLNTGNNGTLGTGSNSTLGSGSTLKGSSSLGGGSTLKSSGSSLKSGGTSTLKSGSSGLTGATSKTGAVKTSDDTNMAGALFALLASGAAAAGIFAAVRRCRR